MRSWQNDSEFSELTGLRIDRYRPAVLLDDDVVTDGQAKPSSFTGWLRRKERAEQLLLHLRRNAGAVVANPDFDAVAQILDGESIRSAWVRMVDDPKLEEREPYVRATERERQAEAIQAMQEVSYWLDGTARTEAPPRTISPEVRVEALRLAREHVKKESKT
jgi:hypothetical protein